MRDNYMKEFETDYKGCHFNAYLQCILDENEYVFFYEIDNYRRRKIYVFKHPQDDNYKWTKKGLAHGSLQSLIFHEFVHRALFDSTNANANLHFPFVRLKIMIKYKSDCGKFLILSKYENKKKMFLDRLKMYASTGCFLIV